MSKGKFSQIHLNPVRPVFHKRASVIFFVSPSPLTMLKFPKLNFEDSSESCYFHFKLQIKTETSNRNFQHQVETSNMQGKLDVF